MKSGFKFIKIKDLGRSVYNGIIGDAPVLKEQLTDYVRRDIKVNPQNISIEYLWDSAEDHASSGFQRWVWTFQNDY